MHENKMLTCWFPSLGHPYLFLLWHQNCVGVSAQSASPLLSLEKKKKGERHNKSQSNQCMQRTTLLRVTHPPHTHSILHSNLIIITVWERGPSCLEVANLRSSYFRPASTISTHPERQQLVLSPTFNSFRKLNSILTLPPTSVNLHNTTQKSTNSEIKYSHKTRRAVESDLSFQVKNYSYNIVIFCKQHSKKQSLGGLLTCI